MTVPRGLQTAAQVVIVVVGAYIALRYWEKADLDGLARYTYGDRSSTVANVEAALPAALAADYRFIVGYGLLLAGFGWAFRSHAVSSFGRTVSVYVLLAVILTVLADVVENQLLSATLRHEPDPSTLITATTAAAIVKWCMALLAVVGVPATAVILGRYAMAVIRSVVGRYGGVEGKWWDRVLADPELPGNQPMHPPETPSMLREQQWSWVNAYNVPGAEEVIARRNGAAAQAICLSGGGVRSACVAMGAMQVFSKARPLDDTRLTAQRLDDAHQSMTVEQVYRPGEAADESEPEPNLNQKKPRMVDEVDYVISVSGGGYTAGARLLAVQPSPSDPELPLLSERFEEGSVEFDHFRRGSSYIADSPAALIRALAEVFKNLLVSLLTIFIVPAIIGFVAGYGLAHPAFSFAAIVPVTHPDFDTKIKPNHSDYLQSLEPHSAAWWVFGFFAVVTVFFISSAIGIEWLWLGPVSERWRLRSMRLAQASAVLSILVGGITVGLPLLMRLCSSLSLHAKENAGATVTAFAGVIGLNYLSAIAAMGWKRRGDVLAAAKQSRWKSILPPGVVQLVLVLVTLAVLLLVWLIMLGSFAAGVFRQATSIGFGSHLNAVPNWGWWLGGLAATAVFVGCADVTSLSLHPFYRRRLARTFAVRRVGVGERDADGHPAEWRAEGYPETEWTRLAKYGRVMRGGPRFVFAAAATLTGRAKPAPGLNAVSYVLSADYVGGPELGWFKTAELWYHSPPRLRRDITVQASIAVSGAAFGSSMGRQNRGFQKLLAVSGARLGTWLPNPSFVTKLACARNRNCPNPIDIKKPWPRSLPTIRGASYLYRELLGINRRDARLVQVSDGGHYENLGLVEALRRRCRLIICIDGGGDAPPLLGGLGDALRLAEYELGVTVTLDTRGPYSVDSVAPGSGTPFESGHALQMLNGRITKGTVVAGRISYPPAAGLERREGLLIVAKAVLWEYCPYWLLTYAASKGNFPHDPTSDQWFNEGQFAAYTALGRIIGQHAVECAYELKASRAS